MFGITNSFIVLFGRAHETSCLALDLYNNWFFPSSLLQFNILKDIGYAVYDDNHGGAKQIRNHDRAHQPKINMSTTQ